MRVTGKFGDLHDLEVLTAPSLLDNTTLVHITQWLGTRRLAAYVKVTDEMLADSRLTAVALEAVFDKTFRPWRYPDPNPMPQFVLFPWLHALQRRLRRKRK
jgi:hypothetical protein